MDRREVVLQLAHLLGDVAALRGDLVPVDRLLLGGPLLVCGLVLRLEPQVRDDYIVQRADRLAERDALAKLAGEVRGLALGVGRERQLRAAGAVGDGRAPLERVLELHHRASTAAGLTRTGLTRTGLMRIGSGLEECRARRRAIDEVELVEDVRVLMERKLVERGGEYVGLAGSRRLL